VTTADLRVVAGKALVNMGPSVSEVTWGSVLEQVSPVKLVAPRGLPWTEVWRLDASPIWHVGLSGIPVVHQHTESGVRLPEWRPWPGEEVVIELRRPTGIPGQTLTIDSSSLDLQPGVRSTEAVLTMSVRASRGIHHAITLPEKAQLESVLIDGVSKPIRQEGRRVTLPLVPGAQTVRLSWRQEGGIGVRFQSPEVDLGVPSVNAQTQLTVPQNRWVLFAGGPRMGPAVLFWSQLLVIVLVAVALGRTSLTPLKTWHWILLGIGLSQVPVVAAAVVAGWLLFLGWKHRTGPTDEAVIGFNLRQLTVVGWTGVALIILMVAIHEGLLGTPDMQVRGNGSSGYHLRWFDDRAESALPTSWVLSAPMLVYRLAMLGWALWLALAMLGWVKWGWAAFTAGGIWRRSKKVIPVPAPTNPPPP
jgi:hypothetical protein